MVQEYLQAKMPLLSPNQQSQYIEGISAGKLTN